MFGKKQESETPKWDCRDTDLLEDMVSAYSAGCEEETFLIGDTVMMRRSGKELSFWANESCLCQAPKHQPWLRFGQPAKIIALFEATQHSSVEMAEIAYIADEKDYSSKGLLFMLVPTHHLKHYGE